jgi:uncharacterized protein DUF262
MAISFWQLIQENKIEIPSIQRDFAQGRMTGKVPSIRKRFLDAIFEALEEDNGIIELDFVYGYVKQIDNSNKVKYMPLDGQQRLTTLFLLHWFVAYSENRLTDTKEILLKFNYATRHSTEVFCECLVAKVIEDPKTSIKETIIDQKWFFNSWLNDPSILSMLVVLDEIQKRYNNTVLLWDKLISKTAAIVFHNLSMDKFGLSDELYIKMNSRGKELTEFEIFKSNFSELIPSEFAEEFKHKIDTSWSDLFWSIYKNEEVKEFDDLAFKADEAFLKFYEYVTNVLISLHDIDIKNQTDFLEIAECVYKHNLENVTYLFRCLEVITSQEKAKYILFLSSFYSERNEFSGKNVRLFFESSSPNLFTKCAKLYNSAADRNPFSIGEQLLFFACLTHLLNNTEDFTTRARIVRNLIVNSGDNIRKENMMALLKETQSIILTGSINRNSVFTDYQIVEEIQKIEFRNDNKDLIETVNYLEDHDLLVGCLYMFNLNSELRGYSTSFTKLFELYPLDKVSAALLCLGNYSQQYDWKWRIGNNLTSTWNELFTPSRNRKNIDTTKAILNELLMKMLSKDFEIDIFISKTIEDYISKPKDWTYYFIRYEVMRNYDSSSGFYNWENQSSKLYELTKLRRTIYRGFYWNPFLLCLWNSNQNIVSLDDYGGPLVINNHNIKMSCVDKGYVFKQYEEVPSAQYDLIKEKLKLNDDGLYQIDQDENGLDKIDRIEIGVNLIRSIINQKWN